MPLSVFHPPITLPVTAPKVRADLLSKMTAALVAESNYYTALYYAGGITKAERDAYYDSHDLAEDEIVRLRLG